MENPEMVEMDFAPKNNRAESSSAVVSAVVAAAAETDTAADLSSSNVENHSAPVSDSASAKASADASETTTTVLSVLPMTEETMGNQHDVVIDKESLLKTMPEAVSPAGDSSAFVESSLLSIKAATLLEAKSEDLGDGKVPESGNCVKRKNLDDPTNWASVLQAANNSIGPTVVETAKEKALCSAEVTSSSLAVPNSTATQEAKSVSQEEQEPEQQQQQQPGKHQKESLSIPSLPSDALHSIASFLTPSEWTNFGRCDKGTNKICRDVFRRVRMHGFRCATEVVTAWKLGQHADAKELCALYVHAGVPIYPHSLGHSYHTLLWCLGVEAKGLQQQEANNIASIEGLEGDPVSTNRVDRGEQNETNQRPPVVDPFFTDRDEARSRDEFLSGHGQNCLTFLEEKAQYVLRAKDDESDIERVTRTIRRQMSMTNAPRVPTRPPVGGPVQQHEIPLHPPPDSLVSAGREGHPRPQLGRSNSFTDIRYRSAKVVLKIHRHLLDQHLLGRPAVDDNESNMITPPVNLSADFYHPHFALRSNAGVARQWSDYRHNNSLQTSPTSSMAAGNLLAVAEMSIPDILPNAISAAPSTVRRVQFGDLRAATLDRNDLNAEATLLDNGRVVTSHSSTEDTDSDAEDTVFYPRPALTGQGLERGGVDAVELPLIAPPFPSTAPSSGFPRSSSHILSSSYRPVDNLPCHVQDGVLNSVDLDVYSASTSNSKGLDDSPQDHLQRHLKSRFAVYQSRLEKLLSLNDSASFEECILDFWDEFLPQTASIHYYDKHTAVPRLSCLHKFLTHPCPKAIGVIQCEIERIKVGSKKGVNMKGRFFPTYEYRLFIRHRPSDPVSGNEVENSGCDDDRSPRRDTVLMMARNRGRKHLENNGKVSATSTAKKGSNNYYLYLPQQGDVDLHYKGVNGVDYGKMLTPNGAAVMGSLPGFSSLLGRLQSNFIGTEFQIFVPKTLQTKPKSLAQRSLTVPYTPSSGISSDDEGMVFENGVATDLNPSSMRRRSRFGRLSLRGRSNHNLDQRVLSGEELSPPLDLSPPSAVSLRRSRSSGDMVPGRKSRPSRRVSAADAIESKPHLVSHPTFFEEEDGAITYTANLLGSRPRIMDVCIPKVNSDGAGLEWKRYLEHTEDADASASSSRMLNHLKQLQQRREGEEWNGNTPHQVVDNDNMEARGVNEYSPPDDFGLIALQNRPPWWNVELGSFVLNFGGRVSVASVKNFQLCDRSDQDYIMLQFGRIQGRHSFTMDFQYPLTGVQAFAIAISSLQSKISFG